MDTVAGRLRQGAGLSREVLEEQHGSQLRRVLEVAQVHFANLPLRRLFARVVLAAAVVSSAWETPFAPVPRAGSRGRQSRG